LGRQQGVILPGAGGHAASVRVQRPGAAGKVSVRVADDGQLCGAGTLAGVGFTMSLFIAGEAFPNQADFAAAKIAIFTASLIAGVVGTAILWVKPRGMNRETASALPAADSGVRCNPAN
jgi:hypothetical protein